MFMLIRYFSIQGDMNGWMDFSDPLDDTLTYNASGLVEMMATKGQGAFSRHDDSECRRALSLQAGTWVDDA